MSTLPANHIIDALKLDADGKIHLYELSPGIGTGTIYFKNDIDWTYLGREYKGIPSSITGESFTSQGVNPNPSMVIGQDDINLSAFKPLIWSGGLDNARIVRKKVLLDDFLNNRNVAEVTPFRVKRVEGYSSSQIKLVLATFSVSGPSQIPFRQYTPPDFPFVVL